ncbi:MAG: hypothetical protein R3Y32_03475 [Bacillota bacterium]
MAFETAFLKRGFEIGLSKLFFEVVFVKPFFQNRSFEVLLLKLHFGRANAVVKWRRILLGQIFLSNGGYSCNLGFNMIK